jgi:hypothetical protein
VNEEIFEISTMTKCSADIDLFEGDEEPAPYGRDWTLRASIRAWARSESGGHKGPASCFE